MKIENSPVFEPGIYASICGSRLLAPTWASRPMLQGSLWNYSVMAQPPLLKKDKSIIPQKGRISLYLQSLFAVVK